MTLLLDKAAMATASQNDLPDSAFAYIEPGGTKDSGGKTTPRTLRHFPIHDAAHVRNALARAPQSPFGPKAMPAILRAAKKFGIDIAQKGMKSLVEIKAEPMDSGRLDRWLKGGSRGASWSCRYGPAAGRQGRAGPRRRVFDAETD